MSGAEIQTDFEHDVKLVRHQQRWIGGSITMMEHIVHPKNQEHAVQVQEALNAAMSLFVFKMEAWGHKVRPESKDGSLIGFGAPR